MSRSSSRVLAASARWIPLAIFASLAIACVELAMQLGVSVGRIDSVLGEAAPAYAAAAALLWTASACGAVAAVVRTAPRTAPSPNPLARALDALIARPIVREADTAALRPGWLAERLRARVVGQDEVCDAVAEQTRRRLAQVRRGKPVGVFLFAGPPGTGKTLLAKSLADALRRSLMHVDMTQFTSTHAASQLFGTPPGYVGAGDYGKLTGGLRDDPQAVVLLDEIEKAHPDVLKKFLIAWNDGAVTEASDGAMVPTTQALFVMTTNAATDELLEAARDCADDPGALAEQSAAVLRKAGFAAEALNRIDGIFVFRPLRPIALGQVAAIEIEALVRSFGLRLAGSDVDPASLYYVLEEQGGLRASANARDLDRAIERAISDGLIEARAAGARSVRLVRDASGLAVRRAD